MMRRKMFVKTRREFIINAAITILALILFVIGIFMIYPSLGIQACIPFFLSFYLINTYYIENPNDITMSCEGEDDADL